MSTMLIRSAAAALVAAILLPAAGFAQSGDRADATWTQKSASACSQLEVAAGVPADQCGKLSLSEVAFLKSQRDNTN